MKKNILYKTKELFPLGIGTWGIGGFATKNPENDDNKQVEALVYMLQKGMNFIEANVWTSEGKSVELLGKAIKQSGVSRENLVITQTIYTHSAKTIDEAKQELETFRIKVGIEKVDSLQFTVMSFKIYGENESLAFLDECLSNNMCDFVSITNADLTYLNMFNKHYQDKMFAHELGLNFEIRENMENGVLDYASKHKLLNVTYQPLRRNRTQKRNWELLTKLAEKYNKTQNQIILNWLVSYGVLPITKSESIEHIDEYIEALGFEMDDSDMQELNEFRPLHYKSPKVYFGIEGEGVRVDQLSNVFDEEYDKQNI